MKLQTFILLTQLATILTLLIKTTIVLTMYHTGQNASKMNIGLMAKSNLMVRQVFKTGIEKVVEGIISYGNEKNSYWLS